MSIIAILFLIVSIVIFLFGIRIVRPTHKGVVERLGKYQKICSAGFNWIIPIIDTMRYRNMTEQLADEVIKEIAVFKGKKIIEVEKEKIIYQPSPIDIFAIIKVDEDNFTMRINDTKFPHRIWEIDIGEDLKKIHLKRRCL